MYKIECIFVFLGCIEHTLIKQSKCYFVKKKNGFILKKINCNIIPNTVFRLPIKRNSKY